ncbi:hypothetical protein PQX77_015705 [Marasmius sp. AFHP31]|nr:hypothetical protein PQX77_015705 [Marasmius sp. AFHP31]
MSSVFSYRPEDIPTPLLRARADPDGLYSHLRSAIDSMGKAALCNAEYKVDFVPRPDGRSKNYGFINTRNKVFSANVFGEVVGGAFGTSLGAAGTHYWGKDPDDPIPITDSTKVKHQIVIGKPSFATEDISDRYYNQIVVDAKEAIKSSSGDDEPDLMVLTLGQVYTTARDEGKGKGKSKELTPKRVMKKRKAGQIDEPEEEPATQADPALSLSRPLEAHERPPLPTVRVGAEYPPNVYPDYGGPLYRHRLARAKQPDVRDESNALIPVWDFWSQLRVGTLIMANVIVLVWVIERDGQPVRKIYHLTVRYLRVLGCSDIPVVVPSPNAGTTAPSAPTAILDPDDASAALQSIVLPGFSAQSQSSPLGHASPAPTITSTVSGSSPHPEFVQGSSSTPGEVPNDTEDFGVYPDDINGMDVDAAAHPDEPRKKKVRSKRN